MINRIKNDKMIGEKIRIIRREKNISQSKLGKILGVTFQQIQKYEKGQNRISAGSLQVVAEYMCVSILDFYTQ